MAKVWTFIRASAAVALVASGAACSSQTITFEGSAGTTASLVGWDKLDAEGKSLGAMPATVASDDLEGQVVKLAAPGKASVYWVLEGANSSELKVRMDLPALPAGAGDGANSGAAAKRAGNTAMRLALRAYRALWRRDFAVAKKLATELHDLHPDLAVSSLLNGLISLQEGQRDQARTAFTAAKALDPEDTDIDALLKLAL